MSAQPGSPDGPSRDVAEEVSRLAAAVHAWWTSARADDSDPQPAGGGPRGQQQHADDEHGDDQHADDEHGDQHASSCNFCPLCRAFDVVRTLRPELLQQVATAAETVAVLLREAAGGDPDGQSADRPPPPADVDHDGDVSPRERSWRRGTPIVVTDGDDGDNGDDEDEGGRTAWA